MRGRVVVLFLVLVCTLRLRAQCNDSLGYSAQFRASYLDLTVSGNDLWVATSWGVQLLDRSVTPPSPVASIAVPGTTRAVRMISGTVYAASGTKIYAIRRSGRTLSIAGSVDTGWTVNSLEGTPLYLYAATAGGLLQYDLLNPISPARTQATFATSSPAVSAIVISGSLLYAADGDESVEVFSIVLPAIPQKVATVTSSVRAAAVAASPGRLYVSDGFSTEAYSVSGTNHTRTGSGAFGASSFAPFLSDTSFFAGTDRRIHAVDWSIAGFPVEVFATDVIPNGGSVNRPAAMAVAGGRLYVAAGDAGLLTFDVSAFGAPYPVRSYATADSSSTAWVDGRLYASRTGGGISEYTRSANGYLTAARQWDSRVHTVFEGASGLLLTASGQQLTWWTLVSTTPVLISSATFTSTVTGAVVSGQKALVVLADSSVWSADLTQNPATTHKMTGVTASSIAHSGAAVVLASARDDGTTALAWYDGFDLTAAPFTTVVAGVSTTGVSLVGTKAAVFTFNGITVYDFAAGTATVLPQSNMDVARRLVITETRAYELTETGALLVWDLAARSLRRTMQLPDYGLSLAIDTIAGMASASGVMTAAFDSAAETPALLSTRNGNSYYRKVAAAGDRLYLFDGRTIDVFAADYGYAPEWVTSIRVPGIVDFAVTPARIFTLTAAGTITALSPAGATLAQATLSEGANVQSLAISTAGTGVWVSIARGCLTGGCEKKTVVYDALTLVRSAVLDGAAVDVTVASGRAYALFDLPSEVRVYDIGDAAHPAPVASAATAGSRTPVSIAFSNGTLYVLGERLYTYPSASLLERSDFLPAYPSDPGGVTFVDQRIRVEGGCAVVTGRTFGPQWFTTGQWDSPSATDAPSPVRSAAQVSGRLYLLTDHSVEIWAGSAPLPSPRRRASR